MRTRLAILGMLLVLAGATTAHAADATDSERESTIKAAMILNFIKSTEWPADRFKSPESPIIVTVLGEGELGGQLERTVSGQQVNGRAIETRRLAHPKTPPDPDGDDAKQIQASHVLIVCESERERVPEVLETLGNASVLTVSDIDAFAEKGGMIGLTIRRGRVAFDANPDRIQSKQLKVSSQVLRLARTVKS
ncbi:MAG TPA: YfiR family protein [Phycisphaerales bacterium]|nr:YfiR family protein [Phycisphaerales bacterium]